MSAIAISRENTILLEHLTACGKLSLEEQEIVLIEHQVSQRSLKALLLELHILTEDELIVLLGQFRQAEVISLPAYRDTIQRLAVWLPYEVSESCLAILIDHDEEARTFIVAMADVSDIQAYDSIKSHLPEDHQLIAVMAKKSDILVALQENAPKRKAQFSSHCMIEDQVINRFLHTLFMEAVHMQASDIHFEPEKIAIRVRVRCDGLLQTVRRFHHSFWQALCVQLKVLAGMDIAESRRPQDGRFTISVMGRPIDFRASCHPTIEGENFVLRLLDQVNALIPLEKLGYNPHNLACIHRILKKPEGMVVMTGPTGSGKTTSLYSMLSFLNTDQVNIMTLEEPVEYHIPGLRQSEVKENSSLSFFTGMHSILRQDPDIILIGEIRDERTAEMAIRAGMTGHCVLTTLHAVHALATIYRLIELKVPISLLAGILNGIVAQRLIRVLCPHCKIATEISSQKAQTYSIPPQSKVYQARGCSSCKFQGYSGRKAIAEVIVMDPDLEGLILEHAPYHELKRVLIEKEFKSLFSDAMTSVLQGETSLEEVNRTLGGILS
jgi:type II secretory ATPase GspE/PulE/Tfp pilus assembly ATPase PilB-like protein